MQGRGYAPYAHKRLRHAGRPYPQKPGSAEPVYFSVPASEADKTATVDLRPYEIFVRGDFLISVENLTHMPAGAKYWIRARLLSRTYTRYTSQAPWKMRKAGVGLSVDVLVEPE